MDGQLPFGRGVRGDWNNHNYSLIEAPLLDHIELVNQIVEHVVVGELVFGRSVTRKGVREEIGIIILIIIIKPH